MSNELIAILAESRLFAGFSPGQLEEAILHLNPKIVTMKSGDRVYKKGDIADRCWLIHSGKLMLKRSSLRSPFRHMIYNKGSVTGIQGLVSPDTTRAVSMIADGKVKLIEITHEGIAQLDSDTQILFWRNVSKILMRKLTICLSQESLND
jgi:threonine dehydrogenase-like Zn-dependent dehydrogenase